MLLDIDGEIAQADALADDTAPFLVGLFAAGCRMWITVSGCRCVASNRRFYRAEGW